MPAEIKNYEQLVTIKRALLQGKTWRYLRYIHARYALLQTEGIRSVLVIGAGYGLAELALALEFPEVEFMLTDWDQATHNNRSVQTFIKKWNIENVSFSALDIVDPRPDVGTFDLVYSVEVLEHIKEDKIAAQNMFKLSNKYVFVLVPYAEDSRNANESARQRVFENYGHYYCGYNPSMLLSLFPDPVVIRGAYWTHAGAKFRDKLTVMSKEEIEANAAALMSWAEEDIIDRIPVSLKEAKGIWWLSRKL